MAKHPRKPVERFAYVSKPTGYHRLSAEEFLANQQELYLVREEAASRGMTVAEVRAEHRAAEQAAAKAAAPASGKRSKYG